MTTPKDARIAAVNAAVSVAEDITTGKLSPADLEAATREECRAAFGTVAGPGDPLWELHVDVARQVLALDGVPHNELVEWCAVHRDRARNTVGITESDGQPLHGLCDEAPVVVLTEPEQPSFRAPRKFPASAAPPQKHPSRVAARGMGVPHDPSVPPPGL